MKKVITIIVLFISFIGFSQIKVVETVPVEKLGRINNDFYVQKIGAASRVFDLTEHTANVEKVHGVSVFVSD